MESIPGIDKEVFFFFPTGRGKYGKLMPFLSSRCVN